MKYLHKLKQTEYEDGAKLCLANAFDHFNAGIKLGEDNFNGFACSHFILALEELAKASVLKIKAIDNSIKIEDLTAYFHKHSIKHKSIAGLFMYSLKYSNDYAENLKNLSLKDTVLFLLILIHCLINMNKLNGLTGPEFERVRLLGNYVELNDDRSWNVPKENFNKEHFNEGKSQVSTILIIVKETLFSGKINKQNINKFFEDFIRESKEDLRST